MPLAALEEPVVDLDGELPFVRPLPHIAVLQDQLPRLFQDDDIGADEEEAELRGEHTLTEKFGEHEPSHPGAPARRAGSQRPLGQGCHPIRGWGREEGPLQCHVRPRPREVVPLAQFAQLMRAEPGQDWACRSQVRSPFGPSICPHVTLLGPSWAEDAPYAPSLA